MSRSYRLSPVIGTVGVPSERADKQRWHRRWRAKQRAQLQHYSPHVDIIAVHYREVSSPWSMGKDGKSRLDKFALRFDDFAEPIYQQMFGWPSPRRWHHLMGK